MKYILILLTSLLISCGYSAQEKEKQKQLKDLITSIKNDPSRIKIVAWKSFQNEINSGYSIVYIVKIDSTEYLCSPDGGICPIIKK